MCALMRSRARQRVELDETSWYVLGEILPAAPMSRPGKSRLKASCGWYSFSVYGPLG
jgi:hypothetical protein